MPPFSLSLTISLRLDHYMLMDEALAVEVAIRSGDQLGEGPVRLPDAQALLWVDIAGGLVRRWDSR